MKTRLLFFFLLVFSFGNAQALLTTPYASGIATTTANLNCYINLNNTYQVSYQIATSSAGVASAANQGSQNTFAGSYNLVKNLTGLLPNTTYYFRFRALAFGVYTNSDISSFTTLDNKPIVWYGIPSNITSNAATINYTINGNGSNTTSSVYYGLTTSSLTNAIVGSSAAGSTDTPGSASLTGLTPNTQYYYNIQATNSNGTSTSLIGTFITTTTFPIISGISVSVTPNTATVNYTLNANGSNATSTVYTLDGGIITVQIPGFSATGTSNTSGNVMFTGLNPNTQYYYRIEATNSNGTSYSSVLNFITAAPPQMIAEYNFDNTYNNTSGNSPFTANAGTSFTTDRNNNPNGAINIVSTGTSATIPGLTYGSTPRSISVWAKTNAINNQINYIFHYGSSDNGNGLALRPTTLLYFANAAANLETANTFANNTWVHYVCTYDGATATVYKNGVFFSSDAKSFNTVSASDVFKLGLTESGTTNYFNGAIDDLKIYNYALSAAEVSSLHSNNNLSAKDFSTKNLKVALYPNPVNDVLNIETETEIKSVEIYNLLGQKVKTASTKQVPVFDLQAGTYMVRVQDTNNAVETMKIVKK
jgi:hypothetical protein